MRYIDLHLHLDGSLSLKTVREIAALQNIELPDDENELRAMLSLTPECQSLDDYLARFTFPCSLLHTREALEIATRNLLDELKADGVEYAEVRFAPQKSCEKGLTQTDAIEAVLSGMRQSELPSGLIVSCMRGEGNEQENMHTVELAAEYLGKGVVGLDLAGAETLFPTEGFEYCFARARELGVPVTIHAGEGAGPESIWKALELGARRIGHGVRCIEDEALMAEIVRSGVTLELCPTSNLNTHMFASYEEYPLRKLLEAGVRVSINTDNMTVSNTTLKEEWRHMIEAQHLTEEEVEKIMEYSQEAKFCKK